MIAGRSVDNCRSLQLGPFAYKERREMSKIFTEGVKYMKVEYFKKVKIAAVVWMVSLVVWIIAIKIGVKRELCDVLAGIPIVAFIYGMAEFARSKGHNGIIGVILSFLSFIGLIIILVLPDKTVASVKEGYVKCYICNSEFPVGTIICSNCGAEIS